jgi:hypothetical protein
MSVPCQRIEYKYRREPFPYSAQWQRIAHVVSQLPETGDTGFQHQSGDNNTFSIVFAVPYSANEEVFRASQIEFEADADSRFEQTHPSQKLVDSTASHSSVKGVAISDTHPE